MTVGVLRIMGTMGYQTRIIIFVDRFFISLMAEESFLFNQENLYVMLD